MEQVSKSQFFCSTVCLLLSFLALPIADAASTRTSKKDKKILEKGGKEFWKNSLVYRHFPIPGR